MNRRKEHLAFNKMTSHNKNEDESSVFYDTKAGFLWQSPIFGNGLKVLLRVLLFFKYGAMRCIKM